METVLLSWLFSVRYAVGSQLPLGLSWPNHHYEAQCYGMVKTWATSAQRTLKSYFTFKHLKVISSHLPIKSTFPYIAVKSLAYYLLLTFLFHLPLFPHGPPVNEPYAFTSLIQANKALYSLRNLVFFSFYKKPAPTLPTHIVLPFSEFLRHSMNNRVCTTPVWVFHLY